MYQKALIPKKNIEYLNRCRQIISGYSVQLRSHGCSLGKSFAMEEFAGNRKTDN